MARQRFIWPSLWTDPAFGQLSTPARLLFIGCFSNADDLGRLEADPLYLKAAIFPHDAIDVRTVLSIRTELVETCRNIVLYEVDDREYLAFRKWSDFQKPKYPKASKLPAPPEFRKRSGKASGKLPESNPNADAGLPSGNVPEGFPHGLGWVGLDREEKTSHSLTPKLTTPPEPEPEPDDDIHFETSAATDTNGAWSTDHDIPRLGDAIPTLRVSE